MYTIVSLKAVALLFGLLPNGFLDQLRKPPTPAALGAEITSRLLKNYRKVLAATETLRKEYEKTPETRAAEIARLKEWEADFRQRIERLEGGKFMPTPVMPVVPPRRTLPKPPIRD